LSDEVTQDHALHSIETLEADKKRLVEMVQLARMALLESERRVNTMTASFEELQETTCRIADDFKLRIDSLQEQLRSKADKSEVDALVKAEIEHLQGLLAQKANKEDLEMLMRKIRGLEFVMQDMVEKYEHKIASLQAWQQQQHNALSTKLSLYHQIVKSICAVSPSLRRLVGGVLEQSSGSTSSAGEHMDEVLQEDEDAGCRVGAEEEIARCVNCTGMCTCEAEPKMAAKKS
jgi:hypothetical protein